MRPCRFRSITPGTAFSALSGPDDSGYGSQMSRLPCHLRGSDEGLRAVSRYPVTGRLIALVLMALAVWSCRPDGERTDAAAAADAGLQLPREVAVRGDALVGADWRNVGGEPGQSGYSRLTGIHPDNVSMLAPSWSHTLERQPLARDSLPVAVSTPLVVGGVMYLSHGSRVYALDGASGVEIWRHSGGGASFGSRGLAYWSGDSQFEPRLFVAAADRLLALNPRTGRAAAGFGTGGRVVAAIPDGAAPLVVGTRVIVPSADGPGIRAWHAGTGSDAWRFDATGWASGKGQVTAISAEIDRSLLYVTFSALAHADNLAEGDAVPSSSLVVLDIASGQPVWQFDAVRRDVWQHGMGSPPLLYPAWRSGANSDGVAVVSGAGLIYLLDRVDGTPLVGVIDSPVPQHPSAAIPLAPTQPVPQGAAVHSPTLARGAVLVDEAQTDSFHASACRAITGDAESIQAIGPFAPLVTEPDPESSRSVVRFPYESTFAARGGTALDPDTGYLFVNVSHLAAVSRDAGEWAPFVAHPRAPTAQGAWPCQPPPWGELVAINTADGGIAWRVPLGVTAGLPEVLRNTGRPGRGSPLATAAGLVFVAATDDRSLRAFASNNGEELWRAELPLNAFSTPMTYLGADGRQYVAVIATGGTILDTPVWSPAAIPQLLTFAVRDP